MKIRISADSTCDLSPELIRQHQVEIIPLSIICEGEAFKDAIEITADDIFAKVSAGGGICTTTAINMWEYVEFFMRLRAEADAVIHFCISSDMSSCYVNACAAAEKVGNVFVVDSRSLSTGIGHLVLDAVQMAGEGAHPKDIVRCLEARKEKLDVSFVLSTLDYLYKGGRCSALAVLGANAMKIKPCIVVRGGVMALGKKYMGKLESVLVKYVRDRLSHADTVDLRRVFITDSGVEPSISRLVETAVLECAPFEQVFHTRAGCSISTHCGPNCLGILFYRK